MKNIVALQTARSGSKSVPKKNLLEVDMHPLFAHSILAATSCELISSVWCSTDDDVIKSYSNFYNFKVIDRPVELSGDTDSHLEVIRHGVLEIEKQIGLQDIVVMLWGNVVGINGDNLSEAISMLEDYDSVVSVSRFNMFNPFRAMQIQNDELVTFVPQQEIINDIPTNMISDWPADKNSAGNIYYCNGNFWISKRNVIFQNDNNLPFQWLGKRIRPYVQDVFLELDAPWQKQYVQSSAKYNKMRIE